MSAPNRSRKKKPVMRRLPKQARSRERVTEILKVSADLIGEKGIDAVTMKEIGSRSGGPIASVYQYFPDKEAILASLYERYVVETRFILEGAVANIASASDAIMSAELLVDAYYEIMRQEESAIDIMNAIKASKQLAPQDIVETRSQVQVFYAATSQFVAQERREEYNSTLFLLFNMADATVRLAIMQPQPEAVSILAQFKSIVRTQASYFIDGRFPEGQSPIRDQSSSRSH